MQSIDRERLLDMLEYAKEATEILGSGDVAAVDANKERQFALTYAVQVIGEAASGISPETRAGLPGVPWPKVIGMRHRLVHGYRSVHTETVVRTVRDDLPGLIAILQDALEGEDR